MTSLSKSSFKSLSHRLLVSSAIGLVSLAFAGQAMAASPHHKATPHRTVSESAARAYRSQAPLDVAAIPPYPNYSSNAAPAPRSRAGYDIAARAPYPPTAYRAQRGYGPQWGYGYPFGGPGIDVRQLIASVLGSVPLHYGGKVTVSSGSSDYDYTPSPDTSVSDAAGWAAEQSANDAAAAASAQDAANAQALDASMAAAEQENDEANAATQQYLINNGM